MIGMEDLINFSFAVAGLVIALLGLFFSCAVSHLDPRTRRFFIILFSMTAAYVAADLFSQVSLLFLGPDYTLMSRICVFCESLFSSMLMPVMTQYMLYCSGERRKRTPLFASVVTLWLVYVALLMFTQFTTQIYTITPDNVYKRGPWYFILLLPPVVMMGINCAALVSCRKKLSGRQLPAFMFYLLIPLFCMVIQMISYGLLMIVIGTSVSIMIMFAFILLDQIERSILQQQENAQNDRDGSHAADRMEKTDQADQQKNQSANQQGRTVRMKEKHSPGENIIAFVSWLRHPFYSMFFPVLATIKITDELIYFLKHIFASIRLSFLFYFSLR